MSLPFETKAEEVQLPSGRIAIVTPLDGWCEDVFARTKKPKIAIKGQNAKVERLKSDPMSLVLQRCIQEISDIAGKPSLEDIGDMYSADSMFLMIVLRIMAYGKDLEFKKICPFCKHSNIYDIDLMEQVIKQSKPYSDLNKLHGFDIEKNLYHRDIDGITFVLRVLKNKDRVILGKRIEDGDDTNNNSLSLQIACKGWYKTPKGKEEIEIEVTDENGNTSTIKEKRSKIDKNAVLQPLSVSDFQDMDSKHISMLRNALDEINFGPDILLDTWCASCDEQILTTYIDSGFLRSQTLTKK